MIHGSATVVVKKLKVRKATAFESKAPPSPVTRCRRGFLLPKATSDGSSRSLAVKVVTLGAARKIDAAASLAKGGFELAGTTARGVDAASIVGAGGIKVFTIETPPEEKERGQ